MDKGVTHQDISTLANKPNRHSQETRTEWRGPNERTCVLLNFVTCTHDFGGRNQFRVSPLIVIPVCEGQREAGL